jgi:hypothetical protein
MPLPFATANPTVRAARAAQEAAEALAIAADPAGAAAVELRRKVGIASSVVVYSCFVGLFLYDLALALSNNLDNALAERAVIVTILALAPFLMCFCAPLAHAGLYHSERFALAAAFVVITLAIVFPLYVEWKDTPAGPFLVFLIAAVPLLSFGWVTLSVLFRLQAFSIGALPVGLHVGSALCCLFVMLPLALLLPFTTVLPLDVRGEDGYTYDDSYSALWLLAVVILLPCVLVCSRLIVHRCRTNDGIAREVFRELYSDISDNGVTIASWGASSVVLASVILLLVVLNFVELEKYSNVLLWIICACAPVFAFYGSKGAQSPRLAYKYAFLFSISSPFHSFSRFCFLPLALPFFFFFFLFYLSFSLSLLSLLPSPLSP